MAPTADSRRWWVVLSAAALLTVVGLTAGGLMYYHFYYRALNRGLARALDDDGTPDRGRQIIELLRKGADSETRGPRMGQTPLIFLASRKQTAEVMRLVDRGADLNARDDEGFTALFYAAVLGDAEAVDYLLDHGAKPLPLYSGQELVPTVHFILWYEYEVLAKSQGAKSRLERKYSRVLRRLQKASATDTSLQRRLQETGSDRD